MSQLKFSRQVPFSPRQMLDLVSDLKTYPDFVPNCYDMELDPQGAGACNARMHVRFGPVNQSYTSRVIIDTKAMTITATALDGPFSHLDSKWSFADEGEGTQIKFEIDFGFSNPLIAAVAEPAFSNIQGEILDAFIAEAKRRYA